MRADHESASDGAGARQRRRLLPGVAALLLYTAWCWSGLRPSFHLVSVAIAVGLLAVLMFGGRREDRNALRGDPFTWAGLAMLAYLALQALNSNRAAFFDVGAQRWAHTPVPWSGLPWSFEGDAAAQVLAWFFPAWVLVMALRSPAFDTRTTHKLLRWLVVGAGLLSLFGVLQFATGTHAMYGLVDLRCAFFASFPYANHAAAYFIAMAALAAGLFFRELFERESLVRVDRPILLAVATVLCLTGANLSLSRAGIVLSWLLAVAIVALGLRRGWRRLGAAGRVQLAASMIGGLVLLFFLVDGLAARAIRGEFAGRKHAAIPASELTLRQIDLSLGDRPLLVRAAWDMWQDHRWYGVGGWGYGQLVGHYVPQERWQELRYEGKANVHCDALQFLVEFGAVGCGLMLVALGTLLIPALRNLHTRSMAATLAATGLLAVAALSCIDLPFRCPAIMYHWLAVLALLPKFAARPSLSNVTNGKALL